MMANSVDAGERHRDRAGRDQVRPVVVTGNLKGATRKYVSRGDDRRHGRYHWQPETRLVTWHARRDSDPPGLPTRSLVTGNRDLSC